MKSQTMMRTLKITGMLMALALACGCGSSSNPIGSSASTAAAPGTSGTSVANGIAECNSFNAASTEALQGEITTYYSGGTLQESMARVRLQNIAADYSTANYNIQFFRWKADASGNVTLDSTPLSFTVQKGQSSSSTLSGTITSLAYADISSLAQSAGITVTTAMDFFNQTVFVVQGVDYGWDAIKMVVYNGTASVTQADFLIPAFLANPNEYATSHPSVLNVLHPYWSTRTQTQTDVAWATQDQSLCF